MRVVVLGADTLLGQDVVDDLVFRGHQPTAVVEDLPGTTFSRRHPVTTARGDSTDSEWLAATVAGSGAVIDVLSATCTRDAAMRAQTVTKHLVKAMETHRVRRYVGLAPHYLYPATRNAPRIEHVRWKVRERLRPGGITYTCERFRMVTTSGLNWTIVRTPALTTGPARGVRHVCLRPGSSARASLTQVDAARFLGAQVLETTLLWTSPLISN